MKIRLENARASSPRRLRPLVLLACISLAGLGGCDALKRVAKSAPAASPPHLAAVGSPRGSAAVLCWNGAQDCYFPTSPAPPQGTGNRTFQFAVDVGYHVLNTLAVTQDG